MSSDRFSKNKAAIILQMIIPAKAFKKIVSTIRGVNCEDRIGIGEDCPRDHSTKWLAATRNGYQTGK